MSQFAKSFKNHYFDPLKFNLFHTFIVLGCDDKLKTSSKVTKAWTITEHIASCLLEQDIELFWAAIINVGCVFIVAAEYHTSNGGFPEIGMIACVAYVAGVDVFKYPKS